MTTIDEAASLRKEDEHDAQERGASREEFVAVPDVPLAGDECDENGNTQADRDGLAAIDYINGPEPDISNEKEHRDWRFRNQCDDNPREDR